jgi:hypothetical protein
MSLLASCVPDIESAPVPRLRAVRRAAGYIVSRMQPDGFITANGSRMYSHAFATVFLSRLCRADPAWAFAHVRKSLEKAVSLIVDTQNAQGGWRYLPGAMDADLSVTACQLVALEEARHAALDVPETALEQAALYVRDCLVEDEPAAGAFRYQPIRNLAPYPSRMSFALAACGLAALSAAGGEDGSLVRERSLDYLTRHRPTPKSASQSFEYYYGNYEAAQAALHAGELGQQLYEAIQSDIAFLQEPDGRWTDWVGSNYATAVATLILQAPRLARLASEGEKR